MAAKNNAREWNCHPAAYAIVESGPGTDMKRNTTAKEPKVIAEEILVSAHRAAGLDLRNRKEKCEVCSADVAPNCTEPLCWVCRRLKISAWRDSDLQASSPE